ncbi:PREDICTED: solute carrier organic anion transporter family member 1B1-like isoform X1 [Papilio xuthus]|uniref:Solute carrier organic anion transporter family member 1B1-like isoform X1 n=1 Tax=Papilio xuthus TaxID=66420 RepID=A0AAJ6ZJA1_PAPXU|nr:PREDICTED: solute carrier organic anion transporter family member 1B1-like isoform X1 [Papilio xuthus]
MSSSGISKYNTVKTKVRGCLFASTFVAESFRGTMIGIIITVTLAEIVAYRLLKQNNKAGDLPHYLPDLLILLLALLEAMLSPFIGWVGSSRRRGMVVTACLVSGVSALLLFALPKVTVPESVGYCNGNNTAPELGLTPSTPFRLSIILFTFIVFGITRVIIICHGIIYMDNRSPTRLSMHYGVLSTYRLMSLVVAYNVLTPIVETNLTVQILLIAIGMTLSGIQVYLSTPKLNEEEEEPRIITNDISETSPFVSNVTKSSNLGFGFASSVYRVFSNTLITTQMVAMGLIAAAVWGFAYHQTDYLRAKYYLHLDRNGAFNNAEMLRYHAVVLAVAYKGLRFTPPLMPSIIRLDVLKHTATMCFFSIIAYVALMLATNCNTGSMAGLHGNHYIQPQCSQTCGCAPQWQEFAPVCVADQMTTYMSPCHAGCSGIEEVDGLQVFTNCTCTTSYHAIKGPCSTNSCTGAYQFHQMLFAMLLSFAALSFQAQGTLLLRIVEPRDKSVLLGLAGGFIALFAFVFGHLIFIRISETNCIWWQGGRCHLHSKQHPYSMVIASGSMVLFAFIITLTSVVCIKLADRRRAKTTQVELISESQITR